MTDLSVRMPSGRDVTQRTIMESRSSQYGGRWLDGPLSPLLANILLDSLDKELERRGHKFARYADDFTILVKSRRAGERVLHSISKYLQNRLKLIVNTTKSRVVKTSQSKFLGFTFRAGRIQLHPKHLRHLNNKYVN